MAVRTIEQRLETVELAVDELKSLPAKVDAVDHKVGALTAEFLQFRTDTTVEFSAVRSEIADLRAHTDSRFAEVSSRFDEVNSRFGQVNSRFDQVNSQFDQVNSQFEEVNSRFAEMSSRFETALEAKFREAQAHARLLHEDLVDRIALLGEHLTRTSPASRRSRKRR